MTNPDSLIHTLEIVAQRNKDLIASNLILKAQLDFNIARSAIQLTVLNRKIKELKEIIEIQKSWK